MYQRFPRVDTYDCWAVSLGDGKGPTLQGAAPAPPPVSSSSSSSSPSLLPSKFVVLGGGEGEDEDGDDSPPKLNVILPDLADGTWRYNRTASSLAFLEKSRREGEKGFSGSSRRTTTSVGEQVRLFSSSSSSSVSNNRKRHSPRHHHDAAAKIKPVAFSKNLETGGSNSGRYGSYTSRWTFWVDASTGAPLRLEAVSKNLWTGGHFDLTIAEFSGWRPGPLPEKTFDLPPGCPLKPSPDSKEKGRKSLHRSSVVGAPPLPTDFLSLALPNRHSGHALYDQHLHSVTSSGLMRARRTRSAKEYRRRAEAFEASLRMVEKHNSDSSSSYKLAINHLADLLPHEKAHGGGLIARHPRADSAPPPSFFSSSKEEKSSAASDEKASSPSRFLDSLHEPSHPLESLPATVDWRGSLADSPVKDQAMCGSCWAFGTVGALEAAVFRETGRQLLMSEQQLVDCAWSDPSYKGKYPNAGCYGGYQTTAFDWYFSR